MVEARKWCEDLRSRPIGETKHRGNQGRETSAASRGEKNNYFLFSTPKKKVSIVASLAYGEA